MTYRQIADNFGKTEGAPERIAWWRERLGTDRSLPWAGLGLIADLDAILRYLDATAIPVEYDL